MIDFERLLRVPLVDVEYGFDNSPDGNHIAPLGTPPGNGKFTKESP